MLHDHLEGGRFTADEIVRKLAALMKEEGLLRAMWEGWLFSARHSTTDYNRGELAGVRVRAADGLHRLAARSPSATWPGRLDALQSHKRHNAGIPCESCALERIPEKKGNAVMRFVLCVLLVTLSPSFAFAAKGTMSLSQAHAAAEKGDAKAAAAIATTIDRQTCLNGCANRGYKKGQCSDACRPGICDPGGEQPYCVAK